MSFPQKSKKQMTYEKLKTLYDYDLTKRLLRPSHKTKERSEVFYRLLSRRWCGSLIILDHSETIYWPRWGVRWTTCPAKEREQGIANIMTTGQGFDGYSITHYGGPVASDFSTFYRTWRGWRAWRQCPGDPSSKFVDVMEEGRLTLAHLMNKFHDLGCNAIINLKFDYVTLEPETVNPRSGTTYLPYVFCVTVLGTAVYVDEV